MVLHSCIVVNSKKPLLPKRRGGDRELAAVGHYCRMHEDHVGKGLSS